MELRLQSCGTAILSIAQGSESVASGLGDARGASDAGGACFPLNKNYESHGWGAESCAAVSAVTFTMFHVVKLRS